MDQNKKQYSHDWIYKLEEKVHWKLYWHQLDLIINKSDFKKDKNIIEIGVGSGFTSDYLKKKGYKVKTVDIDPNKSPDIIADVTELDLPDGDVYIAFEIFEHMPFTDACNVWKTLNSNGVEDLIFSIPYGDKTLFWGEFWLPYFGNKEVNIRKKRKKIHSKHHFWEIGINKISRNFIIEKLKESGYKVEYSYRYRNHHFFKTSLIH